MIEEYKKLRLPVGEYVIVGSSVLELHGIRKSRGDVDFVVSPKLYRELKRKGWKRKWFFTGFLQCKALQSGELEAYSNMHRGAFNPKTEDVIARADIVDGLSYASLEDLTGLKRGIGREKDLNDIKLIEEHIKAGNCSICAQRSVAQET